jgi:REP element-mobilizing transposase RayT
LHAYLGGTVKELGCPVLIVGGVADHVHILCMLSKNISIAKIIGDIKRSSSKWIKTKSNLLSKFAWQNGYGVFSVGQSELDRVKAYIDNQEEHHSKKSFQEELRAFFKKYKVDFDERYVRD